MLLVPSLSGTDQTLTADGEEQVVEKQINAVSEQKVRVSVADVFFEEMSNDDVKLNIFTHSSRYTRRRLSFYL